MPTCVICLGTLKNPAALPCGHVFCYDCIVKVVRNVQPFTQQHYCAMCRAPYTIANLDTVLVPAPLRPHLTPAIRRLSLDYTVSAGASNAPSECDRLRSENASLRACCEVWRKRAAVHAAASLGLVGLARLTRDEVMRVRKEKIDLEARYDALALKSVTTPSATLPLRHASPEHITKTLSGKSYLMTPPESSASISPKRSRKESEATLVSGGSRSPSPCASESSYCSDCSDCRQPATKRRRLSGSMSMSISRSCSPMDSHPVKRSPRTPTLPATPPAAPAMV